MSSAKLISSGMVNRLMVYRPRTTFMNLKRNRTINTTKIMNERRLLTFTITAMLTRNSVASTTKRPGLRVKSRR